MCAAFGDYAAARDHTPPEAQHDRCLDRLCCCRRGPTADDGAVGGDDDDRCTPPRAMTLVIFNYLQKGDASEDGALNAAAEYDRIPEPVGERG